MKNEDSQEKNIADTIKFALTWFIVAAPLAWGVFQTYQKALALFR